MMTILWFLFVVLAVLNLLDILTTNDILRRGGKELNPVVEVFMKKLGVLPGLIISKTVLLGAIAFAIHYDPNAYPMGAYLLGAVIAFYLVILVNNFSVLKELKKNQ